MKIVDNRKKEEVKCFSNIKVGETFKKQSGKEIFIKTEDIYSFYDDGYYYEKYLKANAICLSDGKSYCLMSSSQVIPLKCSCVIEE